MVMGSVLQNASQAGAMGVFLGLVLAASEAAWCPRDLPAADVPHRAPVAARVGDRGVNDSIAVDAAPSQVATDLWVLAGYAVALLAVAAALLRRTLTVRG